MVHGKNRIPYWIDRRLTGLAGPEYHAIISFGLPFESEDSQYGKSQLQPIREKAPADAGPPVLNLRPRLRCGRQSYRRRPSLS